LHSSSLIVFGCLLSWPIVRWIHSSNPSRDLVETNFIQSYPSSSSSVVSVPPLPYFRLVAEISQVSTISKFLGIPIDSPWNITKGIVDSFWILFHTTLHIGEGMWCSWDSLPIGYDVPLTSNPSDMLFPLITDSFVMMFLWSLTHLLWCSFNLASSNQTNAFIYFYITLPTVEWICEIDRARRARSGISASRVGISSETNRGRKYLNFSHFLVFSIFRGQGVVWWNRWVLESIELVKLDLKSVRVELESALKRIGTGNT
jgi:hypothetical protein